MSKPAYHRASPDDRRQSLIEATIRVLARDGAIGASVRTIAIEAGVSPGLVNHHFAGIDALIAATYRMVGQRVSRALDEAVTQAGRDPRARLIAYVTASFDPPIAEHSLLATWVAFWSLTTNPDIAQIHSELYAAYRGTVEGLLAECGMAQRNVRLAAIAITGLVDGLWLELCLSPDVFTPEEARTMVRAHINGLLQTREFAGTSG
jgi:Transcriptional regulator